VCESRRPDGAAAVAGLAARRLLLSEVPPQKHASAFLGPDVIGDGRKPALSLAAKYLELRHEIADASSEDLKRRRYDDAARMVALNQACLLKVRRQRLVCP
jgi:hypothetical protein